MAGRLRRSLASQRPRRRGKICSVISAAQVFGLDGHPVADSVLRDFEAGLRGQLVRPADAEYDRSRRVFNAMIDRHPALIVWCAGAADVMRSVTLAREYGLPLSLRGGG